MIIPHSAVTRIIGADEIKPVRRRVETQGRAIASIERRLQIGLRPFAAADQHQAADHRADLVMEEAAGCGPDVDLVVDNAYLHQVDRLHGTIRLALRRAESSEVMQPDQMCGTFAHGIELKRHGDMPHPSSI